VQQAREVDRLSAAVIEGQGTSLWVSVSADELAVTHLLKLASASRKLPISFYCFCSYWAGSTSDGESIVVPAIDSALRSFLVA
jgi:hypothetical protein